jgi:hypothetical protein
MARFCTGMGQDLGLLFVADECHISLRCLTVVSSDRGELPVLSTAPHQSFVRRIMLAFGIFALTTSAALADQHAPPSSHQYPPGWYTFENPPKPVYEFEPGSAHRHYVRASNAQQSNKPQ